MKVYADKLTASDLHDATPVGVHVEVVTMERPRVRSRGWTVRLAKFGGTRHRNSGTHGAETWTAPAASWDEHGEWMAVLFDRDPDARIANYDGRDDFHEQTGDKYRSYSLPDGTWMRGGIRYADREAAMQNG